MSPCPFATLPFAQSADEISALESLLDLYELVADGAAANSSSQLLLLNATRVLQSLDYESHSDSSAKASALARLRTFLLSKLQCESVDPTSRSRLVSIFAQVLDGR